jgi:dTDP-4-amino-4,6-dideoxygalactose transaminase
MLTNLYLTHLKGTDGLSIPFQDYPRDSSHHLFPILLDRKISRKRFMELLRREGIQSSIHYPPIHRFSYYRENFGTKQEKLPLTEHVGAHEVTLPLYPLLKKKEVAFVCDKIKRILPKAKR